MVVVNIFPKEKVLKLDNNSESIENHIATKCEICCIGQVRCCQALGETFVFCS